MTDDPYPSMQALTDQLVGAFIAFLTITLPVCVVIEPNLTQVQSFVTINKVGNKTLPYDDHQKRVRTEQHVGQGATHVYQQGRPREVWSGNLC